ncbi:HlyD family type I secretion membrane fusion protein [Rhodovulum iodosum]|uniref:Membrane fusion protein (MFP) family protein n=1 Tax=Rhodovulum iodosum TaxID=68291 RepID=A0ABV3XPT9_9RHOB|nr:HlyD family type I secretion periplasmic adaptor subunit [Rhodovulum robiginosum]RSK31370.1 HlyD family type I secretion periplasmic adaptor subunit [Rhodovulum robiginosum]
MSDADQKPPAPAPQTQPEAKTEGLPAATAAATALARPAASQSGTGGAQPPRWRATFPIVVGLLALVVLLGGIGLWSVQARIAGAIVSSGMIQVESNRQVIQHPDGGVVGAILAKDGDVVEAGDVLIRFDDTLLRSELAIVEGQLDEILARRARFEAERDGRDEVDFPEELISRASVMPDITSQIEGQQRLFEARIESMARESEQLDEQVEQIENQIRGAQSQIDALSIQLGLISTELRDQQQLLDKGLTQASRVSTLRREEAQLKGEIGKLESDIARARGQIAAIRIEQLKLVTRRREDAITTLRDLQFREIEMREKRLSLLETLSRMEVRAPVGGVIYGTQVFAIQSVVQPAQPIMYIIPQDRPLIVSSRIESIHIDQVFVGQPATLRFTAFDQRRTPEIEGHVTKLSADVFTDEATGISFYQAELVPDDGELSKLEGQELLPGMPVEAFIKTGDRSPLTYLVKPLSDYFNRAFRE